jgi:2-amino-4-hydroxy-6-hydroxymethyldihydropteridine diphosphokinase
MAIVYLGLGSNLGDRADYMSRAIQELGKNGVRLKKMSTVIETDPVGGPVQGKFLNAAAECETNLSPAELLKTLKNIERTMGRTKSVTDGPRIIDLDILLYDQVKMNTPELTIPHPKMLSRSFVMVPLREIAPHITKDIEQCAS